MTLPPIPELTVFGFATLTVCMLGIVLSGHFPADLRNAALRSTFGKVLITAGVLSSAALIFGVGILTLAAIPWYAAVVVGGLAFLASPFVLQLFPLQFVDGRGALGTFSLLAVILLFAIGLLAT